MSDKPTANGVTGRLGPQCNIGLTNHPTPNIVKELEDALDLVIMRNHITIQMLHLIITRDTTPDEIKGALKLIADLAGKTAADVNMMTGGLPY